MQCLVFDLTARQVSFAGAGHHQLAIVSRGRPPRLACVSSGRPAGLMASNPIERDTQLVLVAQSLDQDVDIRFRVIDNQNAAFGQVLHVRGSWTGTSVPPIGDDRAGRR